MIALWPGRFSTTTCWPRPLDSSSAKARATMSWLPPGTSGTMRWIGLAGYDCAAAGPTVSATTKINNRSIDSLDLDVAHLLRTLDAGAHQEREVGPRRYVAPAHLHILLDEIGPGAEAAHADVLAARLARGDGARVRVVHFRVVVLARDAEVGHEIVGADHHHVDAFHRDDLVHRGERRGRLELHDDH